MQVELVVLRLEFRPGALGETRRNARLGAAVRVTERRHGARERGTPSLSLTA